MFHSYVVLIARHFSWLERTFPSIMHASRYDPKFIIKYLLVSPGLIILVLAPLTALMFILIKIPVGDSLHLLFIVIAIFLLFGLIIREALHQHKNQ